MSAPQQFGPYRIVRRLGAGGMGTVFEVQHPDMAGSRALKVINARLASPEALARFLREAELLARIRHPGVVTIHDLGQSDEGPYLVEDLVEGHDLASSADGVLIPAQVARVGREVADALVAVHAAGILHRDLKPANVVLNELGKPILLDFGLARDVDAEQITKTGQVVGTPSYMAPEQATGNSPSTMTAAVDVYGLGATLFFLATGRKPFDGGGMIQTIAKVITKDPRWPSEDDPSFPLQLEAILKVAMAKAPAQRYGSAADMRDDLDRFLSERETVAASRVEELAARRRKQRALRAAAAVGLTALVAGAGWGLWQASSPDTPPPPIAPVASMDEPAAQTAFTGLWDLPPGTAFTFRTEFEERDLNTSIRLDVWFEAVASTATDGRVKLDVTLTNAKAAYGSSQLGAATADLQYDSRDEPVPDHPLGSVEAALGQRFELCLDPETGAVSDLRGVDAIGDRVAAAARKGNTIPLFFKTIGVAFTDAFIGRIFETLLHVGDGTALPWKETEAKAGRTFALRSVDPLPRVIRTVSPTYPYSTSHRFEVTGDARFYEGRARSITARQTLTRKLNPRGKLAPVDGLELSTRWELHLVD